MMQWDRTFPKLDEAVQALACRDGSLHDRLEAAIGSLSSLSEKDFILQVRSEYARLMEQIRAYRASGDRADLEPELARSIFHLFKKFMVEAWPPNTPV